jgi:hypothetical protein
VNYEFAATSTDHVALTVNGAIDVSAGGRLLQTANGNRLLKAGNVTTGTITTVGIGTVDLNDNDMVLTAAGSGATGYNATTDQIAYARNGGNWNRAGITSIAAK